MANKEKAIPSDSVACSVVRGTGAADQVRGGGVFTLQCFDKDGKLKWAESVDNLVVNVGLDKMNTEFFTGSGWSPTWYIGLIEGPASGTSIAAADTLASHAGWTEIPYSTGYSGNRKACTFGGATTADPSVISNSGSAASFSMLGTYTVAGAFLCDAATLTTGTLFSASDFASPGDRSVVSGDTLNVTYTFSLAAT